MNPGIIYQNLDDKEVQIFCASFSSHSGSIERYESFLTEDEYKKACRFCFPHLKEKYIIGRGLLRELLAQYLGCLPGEILFDYSEYDKPVLADQHASYKLHFNVSHSNDLIVFAIRKHHPVGVDVEWHKEDVEYLGLAQRFFSPEEAKRLEGLKPEECCKAFFNIWTCKEAYIKALGTGLFTALETFIVHYEGSEGKGSVEVIEDPEAGKVWHLETFIPQENYQASVVTVKPVDKISYLSL